jgi:diguanylate cyclase (GGDEF)-like protein
MALFTSDECQHLHQCVRWLDIDDFKMFNTLYGEVEIDRRVLPKFMQVLEAHVFQHGFAYRYGGDEYVILLPNLSRELAIYFLNAIRLGVSEIRYAGIDGVTTVSVGFCYVDADCLLTDREIEARANKAKNFAKKQGKNRIATFKGTAFEDGDLVIVDS